MLVGSMGDRRWIRCLFTREFHIIDCLCIFDALIAGIYFNQDLSISGFISVAMICSIREERIPFTVSLSLHSLHLLTVLFHFISWLFYSLRSALFLLPFTFFISWSCLFPFFPVPGFWLFWCSSVVWEWGPDSSEVPTLSYKHQRPKDRRVGLQTKKNLHEENRDNELKGKGEAAWDHQQNIQISGQIQAKELKPRRLWVIQPSQGLRGIRS